VDAAVARLQAAGVDPAIIATSAITIAYKSMGASLANSPAAAADGSFAAEWSQDTNSLIGQRAFVAKALETAFGVAPTEAQIAYNVGVFATVKAYYAQTPVAEHVVDARAKGEFLADLMKQAQDMAPPASNTNLYVQAEINFIQQLGESDAVFGVSLFDQPDAPEPPGPPPGQTFVLTTGIDTFVGTAFNDVVTGVVAGANTTLNPGDFMDMAGGFNSLNLLVLDNTVDFTGVIVQNIAQLNIDARLADSAGEIDVDGIEFASIDVNLNNRLRTDDVELDNVDVNTTTTIRNADFDAYDIELNFVNGALNATLNLVNLVDVDDVDIYHEDDVGGTLTVNVSNVDYIGYLWVDSRLDVFNLNIMSDVEFDSIYTYSDYYDEDLEINLMLNGDLLVDWWDLPDTSGSTTTFNIAGGGNFTLNELDDGSSTLILNAGSATGNIQIFEVSSSLVIDTVILGAGDDIFQMEGTDAGATFTLGAGFDLLEWQAQVDNLSNVGSASAIAADLITVTDFNGSQDTLIVDFDVTDRYVLTNAEQTAVNAVGSLVAALGIVAARTDAENAGWASFVWNGDTYIYGDDNTDGLTNGDGLIQLVGFTGPLDATNLVVT
jgi:hypothetical protein